jgi:hypothetical protein
MMNKKSYNKLKTECLTLNLKTMKAKALILALAIMGSSMLTFSQQVVPLATKTDCDKKVLNKIKRKMINNGFIEHLEDGTSAKFLVTCYVNENYEVELAKVEGNNENVKEAVEEAFNKSTIACPSETPGEYFTFWLKFEKRPS